MGCNSHAIIEMKLKTLTANLMRVSRGAGASYDLRQQIVDLAVALIEAEREGISFSSRDMEAAIAIEHTGRGISGDVDAAEAMIVSASVKIAASLIKGAGGRIQEHKGRQELYDAISYRDRALADVRRKHLGY